MKKKVWFVVFVLALFLFPSSVSAYECTYQVGTGSTKENVTCSFQYNDALGADDLEYSCKYRTKEKSYTAYFYDVKGEKNGFNLREHVKKKGTCPNYVFVDPDNPGGYNLYAANIPAQADKILSQTGAWQQGKLSNSGSSSGSNGSTGGGDYVSDIGVTESCGDYTLAATLNLVHIVINAIQLIVPMLLVVSLAIVFARIFMNPDDKKSNKRILNVMMACVICFLVPTIVSIVLNLIPDDFAGLDIKACWQNAYNVDYGDPNEIYEREVGVGLTKLNIDLTKLKDVKVSSSGSAFADCGQVNKAGVKVQCIEGTGKNIELVNYALSFEGYPYVWGGKGQELTRANYNAIKASYPTGYYNDARMEAYLDKGMLAWDCSGFVQYVYAHFGYSVPGYTGDLVSVGEPVAGLNQAQPGDILVSHSSTRQHTAIYVGIKDGKHWTIEANSTDRGTILNQMTSNFDHIRRVIK